MLAKSYDLKMATRHTAAVPSDFYETSMQRSISDTLDLARHGVLVTRNPKLDYECSFLAVLDLHPPISPLPGAALLTGSTWPVYFQAKRPEASRSESLT